MQINEIMTSAPITVRESASIGQAWDALRALDIRHLPVVNAEGELVGIVSDRDFATPPAPPQMDDLLGNRDASLDGAVSTIMTGAPISVEADDDIDSAAAVFLSFLTVALYWWVKVAAQVTDRLQRRPHACSSVT